MYQLVYLAKFGDDKTDDPSAALAPPLRDMSEMGIRGMLLFSQGRIIQILEGKKAVVDLIFERMCDEPGYSRTMILYSDYNKQHMLPDQSVGFRIIPQYVFEKGIPEFDKLIKKGSLPTLRLHAFELKVKDLVKIVIEKLNDGDSF